MILNIHIPSPPLTDWIDSMIYYRDYMTDHTLDRLLPDGNMTLIIDLKEDPQHVYDNDTLQRIQSCRLFWMSGIRSKPITIPSGIGNEMFIVNFRKGRAFPFLQGSMHMYSDLVVDADLALDKHIACLRDQLLGCKDASSRFQVAEHYLSTLAHGRLEANPFIDYAVTYLADGTGSIEHLSTRIGFSQKHMIDLFKTYLGMTPKAFARVMRFQKVIADVGVRSEVDWRDIAFGCGYYDHAHFAHDFRHYSGMTPGNYLLKKNEQLNYVPVG